MENGNYFAVDITANVTSFSLNNPPSSGISGTAVLVTTQASGGGNVITWPGSPSLLWEQDTGDSPDQTTVASAVDIYMFTTITAGTPWYGVVLGLDMK